MDSYEVIMTPDAVKDMTELRDYIANVLLVPETALQYIRSVRETVGKLEYMAASIAPIADEPWHSRGIRRICARNFNIYYRIQENEKRVYVLNIIYNKRDQLRMLAQM
ncbi:MAG: type II toxin-antitoxin system RelE/ParE family toxin [Bacteroidales bacterium]|nr:type II toxin-antitoxin system RelE/ParE family toxin [Bacteroidales bacterium]MCM1415266.1 type II toxin-antitoxin system RelE/ParE family toxin [bacterium]MCM1423290.1 type II toxin-antitoxin system RelE/ParE family toxin [bacterium]